MSKKQSYGKTKLSDEHKMQLAQISASIITVAVGTAALATGTVNPLVIAGIAGATTTSAGHIYKFWKTKPDNSLCKTLAFSDRVRYNRRVGRGRKMPGKGGLVCCLNYSASIPTDITVMPYC